jgi:pimeloyl-ACP methyl ester carboxylesterase
LAGCGASFAHVDDDTGAESAAMHAVDVPTLAWKSCGDGFECTTALVPLSYRDPKGAKISLAISRLPAGDRNARLGAIFTNFGGPGGTGVDSIKGARLMYSAELRKHFDIVGFDPRGVGASTPLQCFDTPEAQRKFLSQLVTYPLNAQEDAAAAAGARELGLLCLRRSPHIMANMSTANVARDMDLLRRAMGDRDMNFIGYSYGTYVGAVYANMFPEYARAIAVDGVVDPVAWSTGRTAHDRLLPFSTRLYSDLGAHDSLTAFFKACEAAGARCAFAAGGPPSERFVRLMDNLRAKPVTVTTPQGPVTFTYRMVIQMTLGALYSARGYPFLASVLHELDAVTPGIAAVEQAKLLADALIGTAGAAPEAEPYRNSYESFFGVSCGETESPSDPGAWRAAANDAEKRSPYFGTSWTYRSLACATWPVKDEALYSGPYTRRPAHPLLVLGTRYDPATRYEGSVILHGLSPGSALLTLEGYGHSPIGTSGCMDAHLTRYFVDGTLPPPGATCRQDFQPFDPPKAPPSAMTAEPAVPSVALPLPPDVRAVVEQVRRIAL